MDPRETLRQWLTENLLEDDIDLTHYAQYAGRLASLGDTAAVEAFAEIAQRPAFAGRLDEIFESRCKEGLWDLDEQLGEDLGYCVIEAQDFWCFRRYAKGLISPKISDLIEEWGEKAANIELDSEAVELLERFLEVYPIAEDDQLATVAAPLSEGQLAMLNRVLLSIKPRVIKKTWVQREKAEGMPAEENAVPLPTVRNHEDWERVQNELPQVLCADDDEPGQWTLRQTDSVCDIQTPNGLMRVARQLNKLWNLMITLPKDFPAVDSLRVGPMPLMPDERRRGRWIISLKQFSGANREFLLCSPITIRPSNTNCVIEIANN